MNAPDTVQGPLYLEDLQAGQVLKASAPPTVIDADAIKAFARQFDPQPFHLDETAAAGTLFGGLAASGWHTAALTMRMLVDGGLPLAGGIIGASADEVRWPRPVRPGDSLHVECEVLEVRASRSQPDRGIARVRTSTLNQNGDPVQIMIANLVVRRRPA